MISTKQRYTVVMKWLNYSIIGFATQLSKESDYFIYLPVVYSKLNVQTKYWKNKQRYKSYMFYRIF